MKAATQGGHGLKRSNYKTRNAKACQQKEEAERIVASKFQRCCGPVGTFTVATGVRCISIA